MGRFLAGIVVGLFLASVTVVSAQSVVGGSGFLTGWTITKDGSEICSDPYVWDATQEIECD